MNIFKYIKYICTGVHPNPPPRPEPTEVDVGKITATIHFTGTDEVIVREFEGRCAGEYYWSEMCEVWNYFSYTAEKTFKLWKDDLYDDKKFMIVGDRHYPVCQISYIDVKKESKIEIVQ